MKLVVTMAAANWLIKQAGLQTGDSVAISGQKLANGGYQVNYQHKQPDQPVAQDQQAGINFYVEFADEWFFSGKVTTIDVRGDQLVYRSTREAINSPAPTPTPTPQSANSMPDASTAASRKYEEYWE